MERLPQIHQSGHILFSRILAVALISLLEYTGSLRWTPLSRPEAALNKIEDRESGCCFLVLMMSSFCPAPGGKGQGGAGQAAVA